MLQRVVTEGSGRNAAIDGLTICGKTGTAEIGSLKEREIAWFIAYLDDADYNRLVCVPWKPRPTGKKPCATTPCASC